MRWLLIVFALAAGACAGPETNSKCVSLPAEPASTCLPENEVFAQIDTLRSQHEAGEITADALHEGQAKVIEGACFKAYLPVITDDPTPMGDGPATRMRKLKQFRDAGMLTDAEFQAKKTEILKSL